MTDLLSSLPSPPPRAAASEPAWTEAHAAAAASEPAWTEAHAAAARARLEVMVRQVLDRMPPPVRVDPPPEPAPERFEETDAFKRAVAALIEG